MLLLMDCLGGVQCPGNCLWNRLHEKCCSFVCSCCRCVCRLDNCAISGGCDFAAITQFGHVVAVELKSGWLGRDDAKDAVRQLRSCLGLFGSVFAVVYYRKMDPAARIYLQREARKELGVTPLLLRCGEDLCRKLP